MPSDPLTPGLRPRLFVTRRPLLGVSSLGAWLLLAWIGPAAAAPRVGKPAPGFRLLDFKRDAPVRLTRFAYPGKEQTSRPRRVVVLDFFRTDCKPCIQALPKMAALHRKLARKGVQLFLVALLEPEDGRAKLERFLKKHPLPFPVLLDKYGTAAREYSRKGNSITLPSLFVIDRGGILRGRFGELDQAQLARLERLIEELAK